MITLVEKKVFKELLSKSVILHETRLFIYCSLELVDYVSFLAFIQRGQREREMDGERL